jgi:hypothetical protein
MGLNLIELEAVRTEMLGEVEDDLAAGKLYRSARFTDEGSAAYPGHLKAAVETGTDVSLIASISTASYWKTHEERNRGGKVIVAKVPRTAPETFGEGEFNRFYLRGLCRAALSRAVPSVVAYRAKAVMEPRPESVKHVGSFLAAGPRRPRRARSCPVLIRLS